LGFACAVDIVRPGGIVPAISRHYYGLLESTDWPLRRNSRAIRSTANTTAIGMVNPQPEEAGLNLVQQGLSVK
jgi:hypothetical protein